MDKKVRESVFESSCSTFWKVNMHCGAEIDVKEAERPWRALREDAKKDLGVPDSICGDMVKIWRFGVIPGSDSIRVSESRKNSSSSSIHGIAVMNVVIFGESSAGMKNTTSWCNPMSRETKLGRTSILLMKSCWRT